MVNKAHGKWLYAAADTYFLAWEGLAALDFKLVFHTHSLNTFNHTSGSSTNSCFHSLMAKERLGFVWDFIFCLKLWKGMKTSGDSAHIMASRMSLALRPQPAASFFITPTFMQNWTAWRWEPSCAWHVLIAAACSGQMKGQGWSWNQVDFIKFFNPVPVLKGGCWKIRCLRLEPRHRVEIEKTGHRSAASWEPPRLPCAHSTARLALPAGRMLEMGRWWKCSLILPHARILLSCWQSPVHHHCMEQPCTGTVLQQPHLLSQAWPAERELLEKRFLQWVDWGKDQIDILLVLLCRSPG